MEPKDVILGQYKASGGAKVDACVNGLTPTYFAAALYIDNAFFKVVVHDVIQRSCLTVGKLYDNAWPNHHV